MTTSTIVTMLVGLLIPLLVALVTKARLSAPWKVLISLLLTTASGVVSSQVGASPPSLSGWGHIALQIVMTYLASAVSYLATWKPSGVADSINRVTKDFGLG